MASEKYYMTWEEVFQRLHRMIDSLNLTHTTRVSVYGIPRGGSIVAGLFKSCYRQISIYEQGLPAASTGVLRLIVDDIVDSGDTMERIMEPEINWGAVCRSLVDKLDPEEPLQEKWVVFPWEESAEIDISTNVTRIIEFLGEDPHREGLQETPARVVKSWKKLYGGYAQKPEDVVKVFHEPASDEMVLLKDIEFYSTCEHHMLPFFGKAHIAYIPKDGKVIGISKLARLLEVFSRRLQIQERLCQQVTASIMELLEPLGAACVLDAQHFCMTSRGVEKQNSIMTTSSLTGVFRDSGRVRGEFMGMIR